MLKKSSQYTGIAPKRSFFSTLAADVFVAVVCAVIMLQIIRPIVVRQTSMENTLSEGDYMILYKLAYMNHAPERGDIVIFKSDLYDPSYGKKEHLIKRVIGLPGDVIEIKDDQLYLNGEEYHEDYILSGRTPAIDLPREGDSYKVPEDCYFCMGDNREGSLDSRSAEIGSVPFKEIEGKVVVRLFPERKTF